MVKSLILLPLLLGAAPALAQPAAVAPQAVDLPHALTDPAMADKLAKTMQAVSNAVLDLPVGEVEAAIDGRQPTAAERRMTVRDVARQDDPQFDRKFERQIAEAAPAIRQSMKALNDALPAINQALQQASRAIERVAANMPDPTYPKR